MQRLMIVPEFVIRYPTAVPHRIRQGLEIAVGSSAQFADRRGLETEAQTQPIGRTIDESRRETHSCAGEEWMRSPRPTYHLWAMFMAQSKV